VPSEEIEVYSTLVRLESVVFINTKLMAAYDATAQVRIQDSSPGKISEGLSFVRRPLLEISQVIINLASPSCPAKFIYRYIYS
jgi:hypothetical protein